MNRFMIIFAVLAAMVAALAVAAPSDPAPHNPFKLEWTREPGSPTRRNTIKVAGGQQVDTTHDVITGHICSGWLATGKNAHESTSPKRDGQPSTGGEASTKKSKKGKGKG
ncbi:hypothetical protein FOCC_FOCC000603, partial [Frankliniella occidentalis]